MVRKLTMSCVIFVILLLVGISVAASKTNERKFATKTIYGDRDMNEYEGSIKWIPENVPMHLKAIYVDATLRHGTRFPSIKRVNLWKKIIPKVQQFIAQSDSSVFSLGFKSAVLNWACQFTNYSSYLLSLLGWKEHVQLGQKYYFMMPDLWTSIFSDSDISSLLVSSSVKIRSRASARAFVTSLQLSNDGITDENHPELMFDESKVLEENNLLDTDTNSTQYGRIKVTVDDSMMRYFDHCSKYLDSVEHNITADHEFEKFMDSQSFSGLISQIPNSDSNCTFKSSKEIFHVYQLCAFESAIYGQSIWCELFSEDDLLKLEYAADLKHYYKTGSGYEINYKQSCVLLKNIMDNMNASLSGKAKKPLAVLRFGHAETLIPLITLLDFYRDPLPLQSDNYEQHKERLFRTGRISPFSGNLAIVLYEDMHRAKFIAFVLNEMLMKPFNMSCYFCPYGPESEIFKHFTEKIENCSTVCDKAAEDEMSKIGNGQSTAKTEL